MQYASTKKSQAAPELNSAGRKSKVGFGEKLEESSGFKKRKNQNPPVMSMMDLSRALVNDIGLQPELERFYSTALTALKPR